MRDISKWLAHDDVLKEELKDPAFKAVYDDLELEFKIAEAFMTARHEQGLTQQELGKKVGLTQNAITRLESGTSNPKLSTLKQVASGLGMKLTLVKAD